MLRQTGENISKIWMSKTDSQTPKTGLGTTTDPQQPISEPPAESIEVLDNPSPRGCARVNNLIFFVGVMFCR